MIFWYTFYCYLDHIKYIKIYNYEKNYRNGCAGCSYLFGIGFMQKKGF